MTANIPTGKEQLRSWRPTPGVSLQPADLELSQPHRSGNNARTVLHNGQPHATELLTVCEALPVVQGEVFLFKWKHVELVSAS
ncbi:hypothetical protein JZ751_022987 [Albula glossodonta]|uniref:Uncharacterized protein n=1 Tax=Albula glossodonta TaxID=121402 RepID=A0A8T2PJ00_9TELE|nr:hypothetical protein JZ751_022987 [Albula glossodonta]